jgi:hypothetical protein
MAKFSGKIGYVTTSETSPGIWTEVVTERSYYGDILKHSRKWGNGSGENDNVIFSQSIRVIADPYAYSNLQNMRYVIFNDIKWKITNIEIDYPGVTITTGGVYNG